MAQQLYRFYDEADHLLYVGVTMHLPKRMQQHRHTKPWWEDVARIEVERYADRPSVLEAEREAIEYEVPFYNLMMAEHFTLLDKARILDHRIDVLYCEVGTTPAPGPRGECMEGLWWWSPGGGPGWRQRLIALVGPGRDEPPSDFFGTVDEFLDQPDEPEHNLSVERWLRQDDMFWQLLPFFRAVVPDCYRECDGCGTAPEREHEEVEW